MNRAEQPSTPAMAGHNYLITADRTIARTQRPRLFHHIYDVKAPEQVSSRKNLTAFPGDPLRSLWQSVLLSEPSRVRPVVKPSPVLPVPAVVKPFS